MLVMQVITCRQHMSYLGHYVCKLWATYNVSGTYKDLHIQQRGTQWGNWRENNTDPIFMVVQEDDKCQVAMGDSSSCIDLGHWTSMTQGGRGSRMLWQDKAQVKCALDPQVCRYYITILVFEMLLDMFIFWVDKWNFSGTTLQTSAVLKELVRIYRAECLKFAVVHSNIYRPEAYGIICTYSIYRLIFLLENTSFTWLVSASLPPLKTIKNEAS